MSGRCTDLLSVPLKRTADIDLTKPLKHLIASTYAGSGSGSGSGSIAEVTENLQEFQKLRQNAIKSGERGENAANAIANYYDQISSLEQKIPAHEVQIPFKWKDAFDRGSIFGGRISLTVPSLSYEKVCVLFNLGAISTQVAAEQNIDSGDGLQKALKKLQLAAGIFATLRDIAVAAIQQDPTPDLEPDTLGVLSDLMLAQAQEMVINKAMSDKMKDAIIAKLCAQAEDLFANVMRSMQRENVRNVWEASWLPNVCGKQAIYNGLAQYHQGKVCNAQKAIGEEIARLEYAKTLFAAGIERGGSADLCRCKEWLRRTEKGLVDARKDNDFIYHERIPDTKSLASVAKAAVAKATLPLPAKIGTGSKDLFESLCPVAVHQALSAYDAKKQDTVNREVGKLKEATNLLNEMLSSMNLPAALEDTSGGAVPGSVISKANMVKEAGGLTALSDLVSNLPDLLTRNTEILDECERILKEERESDGQLRNQFKEKWNRTPSNQLTGTFDTNAQKYRTIINNAKQADGVVKEKFESHRRFIEILSRGGNGLENVIPNSGGNAIKGSPAVTKLKSLMEDVETIKAERQVIEAELKSANADMKSTFFEAYNKGGVIAEADMSAESLGRMLGPLQQQVTESLSRQEQLLKEVQENNEKFVKESGGGGTNAREDMLKQLAAAHDAFFELKGNLQEGTKFYNDLTQLLVTFQNKVSDFCFARKTEKEELLKDLTSGMASMKLESTPNPPSHHTPTAPIGSAPAENPDRPPRKSDAPARPPPPAENPYAGAPTTTTHSTNPTPPNPYAGAPPGAFQYPNASAPGMPPYNMYTPMPSGYNPYGGYGYQYPPAQQYPMPGYPPYPQPPAGYPPYPPSSQGNAPGQPPQNWQ